MIRAGFRVAVLCLLGFGAVFTPSSTQAQAVMGDIVSDPFAFYYAYYLPNQQMQAMRPRPDDAINQAVQQRQYYATLQRPTLYNPISPYTEPDFDPLRPYSQQQGKERIAAAHRFAQNPSNADGSGPSLYYGRATQYFPTLRTGRGPNANTATAARRTGGGGRRGGMGMGGMGMGGMGGGMGMGGMGMGGMGMPG
jgi:hypothetical protein